MTKRKPWSKAVDAHGVRIRLFERDNGVIYRSIVIGRTLDAKGRARSKRDIKSMHTSDRAFAERQARALAAELARAGPIEAPASSGPAPLGRLVELYLRERGPLLSPGRRVFAVTTTEMLLAHFGRQFRVERFGQNDADAYAAARRGGEVRPGNTDRAAASPSAGTIRNELAMFKTICRWAMQPRQDGPPLLGRDPLHGIRLPQEQNPARPVAGVERYRSLLSVADAVDPPGRFQLLLVLAWESGRRINAILHLRRSDLLLTPDELRAGLAAEGQDENLVQHWSAAARWRPEWDKVGHLSFSPLNHAALEAIARYLRRHPVIGEGWMFPGNRDPELPLSKLMASYYLTQAEKKAGLPHVRRGGWHSFRRAWAQRRRHLPPHDVASAGGWRSLQSLQTAYQAADPATVRQVVELPDNQ